jgi:chitinase
VGLKKQYPQLKVLLSLGGWGGCKMCSDVFSSAAQGLHVFLSVKKMLETYGADGIDLDWEYPAIEGYPGHAYKVADRQNFTLLVQSNCARRWAKTPKSALPPVALPVIFDQSIEWAKVMPLVNRVNLMSYDLVNGYSTMTGHHTPLFSSAAQEAVGRLRCSLPENAGCAGQKNRDRRGFLCPHLGGRGAY